MLIINDVAYNYSLIILGDSEIEGLTDKTIPKPLGPKRATKIRRLFNLTKEDDVRKYVLRKTIQPKDAEGNPKEGAKSRTKAPKIQRLVTPARLQRKRRVIAQKQKRRVKNREELAVYQKLLAKYAKVCSCHGFYFD